VAADAGVQGGAGGGEGVSQHPAGARRVQRVFEWWGSEKRVEAESGDAAVGGHAWSRERSLRPLVLRREGQPCRPRRMGLRWRQHLERGNAFFRGGGVRIHAAAAIAVEESDSAAGQVLLLGGVVQGV
jgi:hypothetical protein